VVACAPGKADDIAAGLISEGYEVERRTLEIDAAELVADGEGSVSGEGSGGDSDSGGSEKSVI